jgi:hypothetical protein
VGNVIRPSASKARWSWGAFERKLSPRQVYAINT